MAEVAKSKGRRAGQHAKPSSKPAAKQASKAAPAKKSGAGINTRALIIVGIAIVGVIAALSLTKGGSGGGVTISPEEKKYLGRLLPAGYEEPKVDEVSAYTKPITMTPITVAESAQGVTFSLKDVLSSRIVSFEASGSGQPISMMAYVKPSGRLFVGVSFCPPCGGDGQRIEGDGSLTCETCGTKRNLETEIGISGSCKLYPLDELPVTIDGDTVTLAQADLNGWTAQPLDRPVGQ